MVVVGSCAIICVYVDVHECECVCVLNLEQTPQADTRLTQPRTTHHLGCTGQRGLCCRFQGCDL